MEPTATPTTDSGRTDRRVGFDEETETATPDTSVVLVQTSGENGTMHTSKAVSEDLYLALDESVIDDSVALEARDASDGHTTAFARFKFEDPSELIDYLEHTLARLERHQQHVARTSR